MIRTTPSYNIRYITSKRWHFIRWTRCYVRIHIYTHTHIYLSLHVYIYSYAFNLYPGGPALPRIRLLFINNLLLRGASWDWAMEHQRGGRGLGFPETLVAVVRGKNVSVSRRQPRQKLVILAGKERGSVNARVNGPKKKKDSARKKNGMTYLLVRKPFFFSFFFCNLFSLNGGQYLVLTSSDRRGDSRCFASNDVRKKKTKTRRKF